MNSPKTAAEVSKFAALPQIPRARYTDEAFYRAEIEHVFRKSWIMVAHQSNFSEAGSYRAIDLEFAPLVLVSGKDGVIRAFLNACAHRGAAVVRKDEGCVKVLSCPYHGWVFDLQGNLIGVPSEENFPGLKREDHGLEEIRCELWGGFVFVNLDLRAPALLDALAPLVTRYSEFMEAPMRLVARETREFPCNWKIVAEAFREAYHLDSIHPGTVSPLVMGPKTIYEHYRDGMTTVLSPYTESFLKSSVANMEDAKGYRTALPNHPLMGRGNFIKNLVAFSFFPNYTFGTLQSGFGNTNALPISVNRTRVEVEVWGMEWGSGPRPAEWDAVVAHFFAVVSEDLANLSSIQRSLEASAARGVVLSDVMERGLYELHMEIDRRIGIENIPASLRMPEVVRDFVAD